MGEDLITAQSADAPTIDQRSRRYPAEAVRVIRGQTHQLPNGEVLFDALRPRRPGLDLSFSPMASERLEQQIRFILEVDKLKEVFRQTLCSQSRRRENDAEHSWHLCLCVIVLAEHANHPGLNVLRVLKMVILHDLVEIDAGDTFAYDTAAMANQHEREAVAADRIFGLLPADQAQEFRALWDEFEAKDTPEAKFATAVDRFQPMLLNCATEGAAWQRHGVTQDRVLARNCHIAHGCANLWEYAEKMVQHAVDAGHLSRAPGPA